MNTHSRSAPFRYRLSGRREREQDVFFEQALDPALWQPADDAHWDTCWHTGMPEPEAFHGTGPRQTVNHIPGNNCLTIKSRLYRTVRSMRDRVAAARGEGDPLVRRAEFLPTVYNMPEDYHALQAEALENPETLWMVKPKNGARGRDIRLLEDVADAPVGPRWLVQSYLARPHLINARKYVLRLYVVVSSIEPLRVYLYRQGFAKLASCPYTLEDRANPYVHQTNPDVNARNDEAESPVVFIDLERYRSWLREQGHDDERLFARIRDLVALTLIGAREPMRSASAASGADTRGCYELIGLDCLVDTDLNPWLLECNLSPSLGVCAAPDDGGRVEEQVKKDLVADMVHLVGLNEPDRHRVDPAADAASLAAEADAELARAGGFERVYPGPEPERYLPFFSFPRRADMVLARHAAGRDVVLPSVRRWRATEIIAEERLSLYGEDGSLYTPNPTAALIWLHASTGMPPDDVAREVAGVAGIEAMRDPAGFETVRHQVQDALADWTRDGLLLQMASDALALDPAVPAQSEHEPLPAGSAVRRLDLLCGTRPLAVACWSRPAWRRLEPLLRPLQCSHRDASSTEIRIARARAGYSVVADGVLLAENLTLAALVHWFTDALLRRAPEDGELALPAACVSPSSAADRGAALLLCRGDRDADDRLALASRRNGDQCVQGGVRIDVAETGEARPIGLPLRSTAHDGIAGSLLPSDRVTGAGRPIEAVFIALEEQAADAEPRPLDLHTALGHLLPQAVCRVEGPPDCETVSRFAAWLRARPVYAVAADSADGAPHLAAVPACANSTVGSVP